MMNLSLKACKTRAACLLGAAFALVAVTASAPAQPCSGWSLLLSNVGGPGARYGHAMVYDSLRQRAVMFGGTFNPGNDIKTWFWDGSSWSSSLIVPAPSGREVHAMAYDSARDRIVLFGGDNGADAGLDETWEFDGDDWSRVSTTGPEPRRGHVMAYDSVRCRTVLWGGQDITTLAMLNDTWEWDGNTWELQAATGPPPGSYPYRQMAFDKKRGRMVLRRSASTTYEWDGSQWTLVVAPGPNNRMASLAYDEHRGVVLGFNGDLFNDIWEYNGKSWSQRIVTPSITQRDGPWVYDSAQDIMVQFGGSNDGPFPYTSGDTWSFDDPLPAITDHPDFQRSPNGGTSRLSVSTDDATAHKWHRNGTPLTGTGPYSGVNTPELTITGIDDLDAGVFHCVVTNSCGTTTSHQAIADVDQCHPTWGLYEGPNPGIRTDHAMAYHSQSERIVFFGGSDEFGLAHADTWTFDGISWAAQGSGPGARIGHSMAHHVGSGQTVLVGGWNPASVFFIDTWAWNGSLWAKLSLFDLPAHHSGAMVYDSLQDLLIFFGGTNGTTIFGQTHVFNGSSWTPLNVHSPKPRHGHAMAYDPVAGVTVMFGGFDGTQYLRETWEFTGANWRLCSTDGPTASTQMSMAYDERLGSIILTGDSDSDGIGETWAWDSSNGHWINITDTSAPPRRGHAMAYDSARKQMVQTAGFNTEFGGLFTEQTWQLVLPAVPDVQQILVNLPIKVNKPFTLTAVATGNGLSYQWSKDTVALANNAHFSGVTTPILSISSSIMADAGTYECEVTNVCGSDTMPRTISILCLADVNHDGQVSPTDFTAWIAAFNADQFPEADQNCDLQITPADFTAWIANFNAGCP